MKKERFNGWYSLFPYYAAMTVSKLPLQITLNTLFCTVVFFMAGVPFTVVRFIVFCIVGNVVSLVAEGFGLAIGSIFNITVSFKLIPYIYKPSPPACFRFIASDTSRAKQRYGKYKELSCFVTASVTKKHLSWQTYSNKRDISSYSSNFFV